MDPVKGQFEEMIYLFSDLKQEVIDEIENVKRWAVDNKKDLVIEYNTKGDKRSTNNRKEPHPDYQDVAKNPLPDFQDTENPEPVNQYINNTKSNNINFNNTNEEEETITLQNVISFMNEQINKRQITNQKTLTAIFEVAAKCKAIGTRDIKSMENYCMIIVEEKMSKFGQKYREVKKFKGNDNHPIRKEILPEWFNEDEYKTATLDAQQNEKSQEQKQQELEDMLKQLRLTN